MNLVLVVHGMVLTKETYIYKKKLKFLIYDKFRMVCSW
jgi:hypothetical protein